MFKSAEIQFFLCNSYFPEDHERNSIPDPLFDLIKELQYGTCACVRLGTDLSGPFEILSGVRQRNTFDLDLI